MLAVSAVSVEDLAEFGDAVSELRADLLLDFDALRDFIAEFVFQAREIFIKVRVKERSRRGLCVCFLVDVDGECFELSDD